MKVLVTGATGLVGAHATAALLADGHRVRVLARTPAKVEVALGPLGATEVEVCRGDVNDVRDVRRGLHGCDAVVHAAALYSLDPTRAREVERTNVRGTEHVLGQAVRGGLDPIIHVSSLSALLPTDAASLDRNAPVSSGQGAYGRSKAAAERIARALQERGAPVVTFYPGGIWAPHDPTVGEGVETVFEMIRTGVMPLTPGGLTLVDARDLAACIAAALEGGRGPRRFMAGGHWLPPAQLSDLIESLTGRSFRRVGLPSLLVHALGRLGDLVLHLGGVSPLSREAVETAVGMVPCDNSGLSEELGVALRPVRETVEDTLRWAFDEGRLSEAEAGRLCLRSMARTRRRQARHRLASGSAAA